MLVYIACALASILGGVTLFGPWELGYLEGRGAMYFWGSGLILLIYGLVRDLLLIWGHHKEGSTDGEGEEKQKMAVICLESTLGGGLVALGLLLQILQWTPVVQIPWSAILLAGGLIVAFGHATRDWVLIVAKVANHRNLIPSWNVTNWEATQETLVTSSTRGTPSDETITD